MSQLGKAFIEVTADLRKFPAEMRAKLKAAMKEALAGVEFTELDKKAEKAGESAAQHVRQGFSRTAKRDLLAAGEDGGKSILSGLRRVFSRNSSAGSGFFSGVGSFFKDVFAQVNGAVQSGVSSIGSIGSNIGGALGGIGGNIGSILQIAAIAILIPVVIQLAGAFVQLGAAIFALPAVLGVAVAAFAPLIIAFQGFGEAVGAGLSGDIEKFNEALKGLPPSMRSVVKEVVGLKSVFSGVKTGIQEAFFRPLVGVVGPAIRSFLASVTPGLIRIASSLGNIGRELLRTFTSPENLRTFAALLASTNRIVQTMEPTVTNLAQALLNLIQPALPFIERGATAFRDFAARVESFTRGIGSSGQLVGWLERAGHVLGTLVGLAKDVGKYLIIFLGGEIGDIGTNFLDEFRVKLRELLTYIQSPEGKETIHNLGVLLKFVGDIFLFLIGTQESAFRGFNLVFDGVRLLLRGLQALGAGFVTLIKNIGEFAVWLGTGIGHGFAVAYRAVVSWVTSAGSAIGDFFTVDIPRWFGQVVGWFRALPGRILDAFTSFREAGRNFIVSTLQSWYTAVFEQIGRIIGLFLALPYLVQAGWEKTITFVGDFFAAAWRFAVEAFWAGVHAVQAAIDAIPGLLASAGTAIGTFFVDLGNSIWNFLTVTLPAALGTAMSAIGTFFVGLWNDVFVSTWNAVQSGWDRLMGFLYGLPGRVAALGPRLYEAAVGLGRQIANGLSSIGHFAQDIGNKVASALKSAINWVIGKINIGITDIDDQLPVSLPRIPMLARGAVVDSPTLALVGEAGPEVVVPLGNRRRAQELAEQSGLLSMLRGTGGGAKVYVTAYLDPTGVIIPITKTVVNDTLNEQGDELAYARAA